jgi:hypothetical protein
MRLRAKMGGFEDCYFVLLLSTLGIFRSSLFGSRLCWVVFFFFYLLRAVYFFWFFFVVPYVAYFFFLASLGMGSRFACSFVVTFAFVFCAGGCVRGQRNPDVHDQWLTVLRCGHFFITFLLWRLRVGCFLSLIYIRCSLVNTLF